MNLKPLFSTLFISFLIFLYITSRTDHVESFLISLVSIIIIFLFFKLINFEILNFNKKVSRILLLFIILVFLVYSFFNSRLDSHDGIHYTLKFIFAISEKGYINQTDYPIKPYLGEILLTILYKIGDIKLVNLFLGFLYIVSSYLAYKVLGYFIFNKFTRLTALIMFITSPTLLAFGIIELKIDLILLNVYLVNIVLIKKFLETAKFKFVFITSFLFGLMILVKTSAIPILIISFGGLLVLIYYKFKKIPIKNIAVSILLFFLPVVIWFMIVGGSISTFENIFKVKSILNYKKINLDREKNIEKMCYEQKIISDYESYLYGAKSKYTFIQPIIYFSNFKSSPNSEQPMALPGVFLYLGLLISMIEIFTSKFWEKDAFYIYISLVTFLSTLIFLIFVSGVFWYLLPIYIFYSIKVALLFEGIYNKLQYKFLKKVLVILFLSLILSQVIYTFLHKYFLLPFEDIRDINEQNIINSRQKIHYEISKELESVTQENYILDASEHIHWTKYTFFKNWDYLIINSNYYFYTSDKTLEEKYNELKFKKINYILINPIQFESEWYRGCSKENNKILYEFLEKFTNKVELKTKQSFLELYKLK